MRLGREGMLMCDETASMPPVEISLHSSTFDVRAALDKFLVGLDPLGLEPEERAAVELVLAEALNNIIEHAYPAVACNGPIRIKGHHLCDGLHIHIVDEGMAMPDGQTPLGFLPAVEVDLVDMPEGGFGWFLIKDLAKDVAYVRVNGENWLKLRVAVALH
jgi:serine/threonine-protein kinase RsbW